MKKALFIIIPCLLVLFSCKDKVAKDVEVYKNDFESSNISNITGGITEKYNGSLVLGRFNNSGFTLNLNNLPDHDLVTISFDLYIHDSWDGNSDSPDGPDIWNMYVNGDTYISTTFSNSSCGVNEFCKPQSYPLTYPNNYNNPKTGATAINLPPACKTTPPNGTTLYKITKTFRHSSGILSLECSDKLIQSNTNDPKCDESWSVDNLSVKVINL